MIIIHIISIYALFVLESTSLLLYHDLQNHMCCLHMFSHFMKNALLEYAKVVKAKEQVVAGTLHHLTVEVIDAGTKKLYEAKVWVKPWLNFKELQEFKHAGDST